MGMRDFEKCRINADQRGRRLMDLQIASGTAEPRIFAALTHLWKQKKKVTASVAIRSESRFVSYFFNQNVALRISPRNFEVALQSLQLTRRTADYQQKGNRHLTAAAGGGRAEP